MKSTWDWKVCERCRRALIGAEEKGRGICDECASGKKSESPKQNQGDLFEEMKA